MIRTDLYDTTTPTTAGGSSSSNINGDKRGEIAFAFYNSDALANLPSYFDTSSNAEKPRLEALRTDVADAGERNVVETKEKEEEGPKRPGGLKLSEVWWDFLGETSLHGCKNVKERSMVKRLVWCCLLLLMAASMSWALLNLFLRYQQHPFVSVWGFQREGTILAPGITICLPSRYSKKKFKASRPAFQLLLYELTGNPMIFNRSQEDAQHEVNVTEQLRIWEKELETVSVRRARREIGFTTPEIIAYASLFHLDREIDIMHKIMYFEMETVLCWWVQWLLPDETLDEADSADTDEKKKKSSSSEDGTISSFETDSSGENNGDSNNDTTTPEPRTAATAVSTLNKTSFVRKTSMLNNFRSLSTPSPSAPPFQMYTPTTTDAEAFESGGDQDASDQLEDEKEERARAVMLNQSDLLRLEPQDAIVFTINLKQNNWMGEILSAGVDLYLHDPVSAFWSVQPIYMRPGTSNFITYKTTHYKFLPPPYKSFAGAKGSGDSSENTGCLETRSSSFRSPMATARTEFYSSDTCALEYATNRSMQHCGCGVDKFYNKLHRTPQCSILQHMRCFEPTLIREYEQLMLDLATGSPADHVCPQACSYTTFETITSAADFPTVDSTEYYAGAFGMEEEMVSKNILMIQIQPQGPLSVSVEHVPELTVLGILGSVGGWMGLCLGASLLTLTEFFEAAAMSVWILYRKFMYCLRG